MSFKFTCIKCSHSHDQTQYRTLCTMCGSLLRAQYDQSKTKKPYSIPDKHGIGKYQPMLPITNSDNIVTMGEGNTPIIKLTSLAKQVAIQQVYAKLEYVNPTGSFKDRGNAVQTSVLKELGINRLAEIGAGNTGHSLASYCVRAGITMDGFTSIYEKDSSKVKVIEGTGAHMHWIEGNKEKARKAMTLYCKETGILDLTYHLNPYFIEGNKTMAYEIVEQMDPLPENIVMTVGNGSQLLGLWWGFNEMKSIGRIARIPKLHGVQSTAFQPMVAAFHEKKWQHNDNNYTIAVGIRIPAPPRLEEAVKACKQSGGHFIAVPDEETLDWQQRLNMLEGLFVEATTSVALAGATRMIENEIIPSDENILFILGGSGFKEPIP